MHERVVIRYAELQPPQLFARDNTQGAGSDPVLFV